MEPSTVLCPACRAPIGTVGPFSPHPGCPRCAGSGPGRPRRQRGCPAWGHITGILLVVLAGIGSSALLLLQLRASRFGTVGGPDVAARAPAERTGPIEARETACRLAASNRDKQGTAPGGGRVTAGVPTDTDCCAAIPPGGLLVADAEGFGDVSCPSEPPSRTSSVLRLTAGAAPASEGERLEPSDPPESWPGVKPLASRTDSGHVPDDLGPPIALDDPSADPDDDRTSAETTDTPPADGSPRRIRVRDHDGRVHVARVYGGEDSGVVLLPDGRLGWPEGLVYTDEPFVPATKQALQAELLGGEYCGFSALETEHYLILYRGTIGFARSSGNLLESLYCGLLDAARRLELPAREAEFPLVAVIYEDEAAFRAANQVEPDVAAYYDIATNRIHLFETSARDREAPDLAARRKPQTVAHEGAHQVLQNIGVHPRLASWPPWLVEGLAEFFAPTTVRQGDTWAGPNRVNPFHMATIRELEDPLAPALQQHGLPTVRVDRRPGTPLVEHLVTRTTLAPTDYALAWVVTHFLFNTQGDAFRAYLRELAACAPLEPMTPEDHLEAFRQFFGRDLARTDRAIGRYLARLKDVEPLAHYAVLFEQPIGPSVIRRAALVSQSPAMILQWVEENTSAQGGPVSWRALPFPTRSRAILTAEGWLGRGR